MQEFRFFKPVSPTQSINIIDESNVERSLSVKEAEEKFGIKWLEENSINTVFYEKFLIKYMGKELGWGLFAKKQIHKDEIIGILTGEIYFQDRNKKITSTHILLSDAPNNQFQVVDAETCGNFTRFIQHLPTQAILDKIEFKQPEIKSDVAICNVRHEIIQLNNSIVTEKYIASKTIYAGEIIGSNYDPNAWLDKKPCLFKKNGSLIAKEVYVYPTLTSGKERPKYSY